MLRELSASLELYLEDNPQAGLWELEREFGFPEDISECFAEQTEGRLTREIPLPLRVALTAFALCFSVFSLSTGMSFPDLGIRNFLARPVLQSETGYPIYTKTLFVGAENLKESEKKYIKLEVGVMNTERDPDFPADERRVVVFLDCTPNKRENSHEERS